MNGDLFLVRVQENDTQPLVASDSFEQIGFILKGVLRGRPLGCIFALSLQRQIFPDPI